jgi:hypothetical protein
MAIVAFVVASAPLAMANGARRPATRLMESINANELRAGSYQGYVNGQSVAGVHLMVEPIAERPGSFVATILQLATEDLEAVTKVATTVYVVDPLADGRYMMTPFTAGYSSLGLFNDNPTLSLSLSHDRIKITALRDNQNGAGIQDNMTFLSDSMLHIRPAADGVFVTDQHPDSPKAIVAQDTSSVDLNLSPTRNLSLSGKYALTKSVGSIYVLKGKKVSAYGEEDELRPTALGIFVDVIGYDGNYKDTVLVVTDIAGSGASVGLKLNRCKRYEDQRCKR